LDQSFFIRKMVVKRLPIDLRLFGDLLYADFIHFFGLTKGDQCLANHSLRLFPIHHRAPLFLLFLSYQIFLQKKILSNGPFSQTFPETFIRAIDSRRFLNRTGFYKKRLPPFEADVAFDS